ncbi:MAG: class I SAM-dependent methyltransferase [Bacteroidota bacterium]|nr:class I SAM-dependent methyltransferase [Bacteroidota bacterium]
MVAETGILAGQIARQLSSGTVTAIDKSVSMIKMASRRNKPFIETGKAHFIISDFLKSELNEAAFDKIFGFNVNIFWKDATRELELIKLYLKPKGHLYIFYQAPYDIDIKAAKPITENLQSNSFQVIDTIFKKMSPASAFCIVSRPIIK